MTARRFMVLFENFPIKESQVKSGNNTREVIVASRCVNVALFVSGNLRRNVSISIAWGETRDLRVITFPGEILKRVSPDERSIAFFLLKSTNEAGGLSAGQGIVMENGIEVKRTGFESLLEDWSPSSVYAAQKGTKDSEEAISRKVGVFVYGMGIHENPKPSTQIIALPRPPNPERFILDINLKADRE
jgi:tRNA pseudouridine-54 N-methylase